jgi:hypothetical protein
MTFDGPAFTTAALKRRVWREALAARLNSSAGSVKSSLNGPLARAIKSAKQAVPSAPDLFVWRHNGTVYEMDLTPANAQRDRREERGERLRGDPAGRMNAADLTRSARRIEVVGQFENWALPGPSLIQSSPTADLAVKTLHAQCAKLRLS